MKMQGKEKEGMKKDEERRGEDRDWSKEHWGWTKEKIEAEEGRVVEE
jgi:hypothetical protein